MGNNESPKRILLAEDDEDDFVLFREALNAYDTALQFNWVKDGEELMELLKMDVAVLPDMIFLDINMPRKNGFECLSEIRQHEDLKKLPVIIFSTSNDPALISWMYNSGANLYLKKPTDFNELKEKVQKVIAIDWKKQGPYLDIKKFVL